MTNHKRRQGRVQHQPPTADTRIMWERATGNFVEVPVTTDTDAGAADGALVAVDTYLSRQQQHHTARTFWGAQRA